MEVDPFFSVIITTYNREKFISKAITSVINQSFKNWELIIVDDGSTDNTNLVIKSFLVDERVKYFFQKNQERCVARNNGIAVANGKYLCFLDSDDYYLNNHLDVFYNKIKELNFPNKVILYTNRSIDRDGIISHVPYVFTPSKCKIENLINFGILCAPANLTSCISTNIENKNLFSNRWLPFNELYHFTFELLKIDYCLVNIDKYTSVIVQHGDNTTASNKFTEGRYDYITWASTYLDVTNDVVIRKTRANLMLSMAFHSTQILNKFKLALKSIKIYPFIILTRPFLGFLKKSKFND